jgi:hypothetical protein
MHALISVAFEVTFMATLPSDDLEAKQSEIAEMVEKALCDLYPETMIRRLENVDIEAWT